MISRKMQGAMNQQINWEAYSSYLYMAMAAYFDEQGLGGFAHWFKVQAQEEMTHLIRFYNHIYERGGSVNFTAVAAPESSWDSPLACFQATAGHEAVVSGRINDLMTLAKSENDYASETFLAWFVSEQVEEEASALELVKQLKLVGSQGDALLLLDRELGSRQFNMSGGLVF